MKSRQRIIVCWLMSILWLGLALAHPVQAAPPPQNSSDCETLYQAGQEAFNQKDYTEAIPKYADALECYREIGNQEGEQYALFDLGRAHNLLGVIYHNDDRYKEALAEYKQALTYERQAGDWEEGGYTLNNIGNIYYSQKLYAPAIANYQQALSIKRTLNDQAGEGVVLRNMANAYKIQGAYAEALPHYLQALVIKRDLDDRAGEAAILNSIGDIYVSQERYEDAQEVYEAALKIYQTEQFDQVDFDPEIEEAYTRYNLGRLFFLWERYDEAQEQFEQSKKVYLAKEDRPSVATLFDRIGDVYREKSDYDQAEEQYSEALEIWRQEERPLRASDTLSRLGDLHNQQEQYEPARQDYLQALKELGDSEGQQRRRARLSNKIGQTYQAQSDYVAAQVMYQRAVNLYQELVEPLGQKPGDEDTSTQLEQATSYNYLGTSFYALGNYSAALINYQTAQNIQQQLGDAAGENETRLNLGRVRQAQGRFDEALELYQEALFTLQKNFDDPPTEVDLLNYMGQVDQARGQYEPALAQYRQAQDILTDTKKANQRGQAMTLQNLASLAYAQGNYDESRQKYEEALEIWEKLGDKAGISGVKTSLGNISQTQGDYSTAQAQYAEALEIQEKIGDRVGQIKTLVQIGQVFEAQALYEEALVQYTSALTITHEVDDRLGEGQVRYHLGRIFHAQGSYEQALSNYQQALDFQKEAGVKVEMGLTYTGIGSVYQAQGRSDKAQEEYKKAQDSIGDHPQAATVLNHIGRAYQAQGETGKALASYEAVFIMTGRLKLDEADAQTGLGIIYQEKGEYKSAQDSYESALEIYRQMANRRNQAETLHHLGEVAEAQGDYTAAQEWYSKALDTRPEGDLAGQAVTLFGLGRVVEAQENETEALKYYQQAISRVEAVRAGAGSGQGRAGVMAQYADLYERAVGLLYPEQPEAAFELSEQGRATAFLDSLSGRSQLTDDTTASLRTEKETLYQKLQSAQEALGQALAKSQANPSQAAEDELAQIHNTISDNQKLLDQLRKDVEDAQAAYDRVIEQLESRSEPPAICEHSGESNLSQIQAELDPQTMVLSYFVLAKQTLVFQLTQDEIKLVELDISSEDLNSAVKDFRELIRERNPKEIKPMAEELYDQLIGPLSAGLKPRLLLVPYGPLHSLPFAALRNGETGYYLAQSHILVTLPSASALPCLKQNTASSLDKLLVLGNPTIEYAAAQGFGPLPAAEQEAKTIADLYDTQALTGTAATEGIVRQQAGQVNILHLASHGEYDDDNPLESTLYLAPDPAQGLDGRLQVREIYDLDLANIGLVVLSACDTQKGQSSAGDEVMGLSRAFLEQQAATVVASLWPVEDTASSQLMSRFYYNLRQGRGKAEALTMAQAAMMRDYPDDPYIWADFVLSGDAGPISDKTIEALTAGQTITPAGAGWWAELTNRAGRGWMFIALVVGLVMVVGFGLVVIAGGGLWWWSCRRTQR